MITVAAVILAVAAGLFVVRLLLGPTVADRVVALDGLIVTIVSGVLVNATAADSAIIIDTLLVVVLLSFVGTGVLARYIEQRGG
jgi:multisubunit Na+/H+ antiporter MnhF subunit